MQLTILKLCQTLIPLYLVNKCFITILNSKNSNLKVNLDRAKDPNYNKNSLPDTASLALLDFSPHFEVIFDFFILRNEFLFVTTPANCEKIFIRRNSPRTSRLSDILLNLQPTGKTRNERKTKFSFIKCTII